MPYCIPHKFVTYHPDKYAYCKNFKQISCFRSFQNTTGMSHQHCHCDYVPLTKGRQSMVIIAAICLPFTLILIYIRIFVLPLNIRQQIALIVCVLLCIALFTIFMGLLLIGVYREHDALERIYNRRRIRLDSIAIGTSNTNINSLMKDLRRRLDASYEIRIGWATGLEITVLFLILCSLISTIFLALSSNRTF
ncbi:unnamed protein product [Didymodactylos carnosus]|uniref:Uncharacterized protein n=1 Tax=Didymodactylos carnosus TaxID=1234261 RepID=A0A8S2CLS5_9BILA|nr:unnamed protein product [Didymodactylos carnosus]CAF3520328.1 unnamed protein product [Didymodactylos carnosus]